MKLTRMDNMEIGEEARIHLEKLAQGKGNLGVWGRHRLIMVPEAEDFHRIASRAKRKELMYSAEELKFPIRIPTQKGIEHFMVHLLPGESRNFLDKYGGKYKLR